jgi:hypothetical protein
MNDPRSPCERGRGRHRTMGSERAEKVLATRERGMGRRRWIGREASLKRGGIERWGERGCLARSQPSAAGSEEAVPQTREASNDRKRESGEVLATRERGMGRRRWIGSGREREASLKRGGIERWGERGCLARSEPSAAEWGESAPQVREASNDVTAERLAKSELSAPCARAAPVLGPRLMGEQRAPPPAAPGRTTRS